MGGPLPPKERASCHCAPDGTAGAAGVAGACRCYVGLIHSPCTHIGHLLLSLREACPKPQITCPPPSAHPYTLLCLSLFL